MPINKKQIKYVSCSINTSSVFDFVLETLEQKVKVDRKKIKNEFDKLCF